jgi:hypothetical protein
VAEENKENKVVSSFLVNLNPSLATSNPASTDVTHVSTPNLGRVNAPQISRAIKI